MAVAKGAKRYQHIITEEVRYFKSPPNMDQWNKIGTGGSKDWRWIHNATEEKFVKKSDPVPEGSSLGRIKT